MSATLAYRVLIIEPAGAFLYPTIKSVEVLRDSTMLYARGFDHALCVLHSLEGIPDLTVIDLDTGSRPQALAILRALEHSDKGAVRPVIAVARRKEDLEGFPPWVVVLPKHAAEFTSLTAAVNACLSPEKAWARSAADSLASMARKCTAAVQGRVTLL